MRERSCLCNNSELTAYRFFALMTHMVTFYCIGMLHAMLAFLPLALTFPENPNSIDSPKAWHPLSTGIGKLPPASLRGWWDASKLNANDIYWGSPYIPDNNASCGGEIHYFGSGVAGGNILTINPETYLNVPFLYGTIQPGQLLKFEGSTDNTPYTVVQILDANRFVVTPNFTSTYASQRILVAQLHRWPDASGNREDMVYWPLAGIHTPGVFILDSNSGKVFQDGHIAHLGQGHQMLSGIAPSERLSLGHNTGRRSVVVHELIIGKGPLNSNVRIELEGYLAWKWGADAKLGGAHPYAQVPPTAAAQWSPTELGNDLWLWLDANASHSIFTDVGCSALAAPGSSVACWKDLSPYQRHLYQGNDLPIAYGYNDAKLGITLNYDSVKGPTALETAGDATWLNTQPYFVAMVTEKSTQPQSLPNYAHGPLRIGGKYFFPFYANACIGVGTVANNPTIATQYTAQKSTLVLQGNVRNQPFYQPYFNSTIKSSLTTRSAPTYLHNQPYLLAVVASALTEPSPQCSTLLGTLLLAGLLPSSNYQNRALSFGAALYIPLSSISFAPGKLWLDQGWSDNMYNAFVSSSPTLYLAWRKSAQEAPWVTVNGLPREAVGANNFNDTKSYLRVLEDQLVVLSMGDYAGGNACRFSGSIYEAMVLTGPNIKYGHQRLIEGYLAWKWGLQHKLPKSHSYRRVPPAR